MTSIETTAERATTLTAIYQHPVKSVGAQSLRTVRLSAGQAMPYDRRFAITHGKSEFNRSAPEWMRCKNFLRIANIPEFAALDLDYDPDSQMLTVQTPNGPVDYDMGSPVSRSALAKFLEAIVDERMPGPFDIVDVPGISLSDSPDQAVSIAFRSSLQELEAAAGAPLDPRRFRINLWLDDAPAWQEFDLVGREFQIGDLRFRGIEKLTRCLVPAANPSTGKRDTNPLKVLSNSFGHSEFGITAEVLAGGTLSLGATFGDA